MFGNDKVYVRSNYRYLTAKLLLEESRKNRRYNRK